MTIHSPGSASRAKAAIRSICRRCRSRPRGRAVVVSNPRGPYGRARRSGRGCGASGEIDRSASGPAAAADRRIVADRKDTVAGNSDRLGDASLRIERDDFAAAPGSCSSVFGGHLSPHPCRYLTYQDRLSAACQLSRSPARSFGRKTIMASSPSAITAAIWARATPHANALSPPARSRIAPITSGPTNPPA